MEEEQQKEEKVSAWKEVFDWFRTVAITLVIVAILKSQVIIMARIPSGSMLDTIQIDEKLMGNRLAYAKKEPKRGDIVIFYAPDRTNTLYIKRVVGLPGEKVAIKEGEVFIGDSDKPLEEDYLKPEPWVVRNDGYEFDVPEDSYLLLGDNRNSSEDARCWEHTYVKGDAIIAKAVFVWYPVTHMRTLK